MKDVKTYKNVLYEFNGKTYRLLKLIKISDIELKLKPIYFKKEHKLKKYINKNIDNFI